VEEGGREEGGVDEDEAEADGEWGVVGQVVDEEEEEEEEGDDHDEDEEHGSPSTSFGDMWAEMGQMADEDDDEEDEGHGSQSMSFEGTHDEDGGDDADDEEVVYDAAITERLESSLAAVSAALERETTDVSGLDLDALVELDGRITQLHERAATFRDTLAATRAGVQCAITHRRCAVAVEKAQPDFVCSISYNRVRDPVVNLEP
jgi:hypothetical protein